MRSRLLQKQEVRFYLCCKRRLLPRQTPGTTFSHCSPVRARRRLSSPDVSTATWSRWRCYCRGEYKQMKKKKKKKKVFVSLQKVITVRKTSAMLWLPHQEKHTHEGLVYRGRQKTLFPPSLQREPYKATIHKRKQPQSLRGKKLNPLVLQMTTRRSQQFVFFKALFLDLTQSVQCEQEKIIIIIILCSLLTDSQIRPEICSWDFLNKQKLPESKATIF